MRCLIYAAAGLMEELWRVFFFAELLGQLGYA